MDWLWFAKRASVWVTGGNRCRVNQENPPMRIYIIGNDGITLSCEAPATVNDGEIAVASNEELHAAPLNGKRLLALWNASVSGLPLPPAGTEISRVDHHRPDPPGVH
jgi:hypothetical protein